MKIADINKMSPKSGSIIGEDGQVYNQVTLMNTSGIAPAVAGNYDISRYAPSSGRLIGEDGQIYNLVDLLQALSGGGDVTVTWADIQNKPTSFTPSTHAHAIAEVTNLQTTLNGKSAASHTHATGITAIADPTTATAVDVANKVNEILTALQT